MRVIIEKNYENLSLWVATYIKTQINNYNSVNNSKPFVLGLPTGSTPIGVYNYLIQYYNNNEISFKNVVTFNMDEYVGLPPDDKNSYNYFMYNHFFNHIDLPRENINLLNGLADNLQEECDIYEEKIRKYGGINLFLCGIGSDGHIAFNEPGSSMHSNTRLKTLSEETIQDNSRFFSEKENIPKQAITVGINTVLSSQDIIIMSSGIKKARATKELIEGSITAEWPCTFMQTHLNTKLVCDEDSVREIKYKNYLYHQHVKENTDLLGFPIINYINKYIAPTDKILITSPHPDDDVIGMGGTMDLLPNKQNVKICYFTNGIGGLKDLDNIGENTRIKEAVSSINILGYNEDQVINMKSPFYFTPERTVSHNDINLMSNIINGNDPQHIFICADQDPKKTHLKCLEIIHQSDYIHNRSLKNIWLYKSAWGIWNENNNNNNDSNNNILNLRSNITNYIPPSNFRNKLLSIDMHISQRNPMVIYNKKIESFKDIVCVQNKSENYLHGYEEQFRILTPDEFMKCNI